MRIRLRFRSPLAAGIDRTERGTNSISSYTIDEHDYAQGPTTIKSRARRRMVSA